LSGSENKRTSSSGLMLVEDPEQTLKALCHLQNSIITWRSFKSEYEEVIGRKSHPVDEKTVDTHFYSLRLFGLITATSERSFYVISVPGSDLCESLRCGERKKFQKMLASVLLTNPIKGDLFKRFLDFVNNVTTKDQVLLEFKNIPGRSLIAWSLLAGLIGITCFHFR